jgi:hypothetical protein
MDKELGSFELVYMLTYMAIILAVKVVAFKFELTINKEVKAS